MLSGDLQYNPKLSKRQFIIRNGDMPVAMLETGGYENIEKFKKHVEKVMEIYADIKNMIKSGEPIKKYNPTPVPKFIHIPNNDGTAVTLKYDGVMFAHLSLKGINDMNMQLKYIYKVFQSFKRYSNVCVDI